MILQTEEKEENLEGVYVVVSEAVVSIGRNRKRELLERIAFWGKTSNKGGKKGMKSQYKQHTVIKSRDKNVFYTYFIKNILTNCGNESRQRS